MRISFLNDKPALFALLLEETLPVSYTSQCSSLPGMFTEGDWTELWVSCLLVAFISYPDVHVSLSGRGAGMSGTAWRSLIFSTNPAKSEEQPGRWVKLLQQTVVLNPLVVLSLRQHQAFGQVQNQLQSTSGLQWCWLLRGLHHALTHCGWDLPQLALDSVKSGRVQLREVTICSPYGE